MSGRAGTLHFAQRRDVGHHPRSRAAPPARSADGLLHSLHASLFTSPTFSRFSPILADNNPDRPDTPRSGILIIEPAAAQRELERAELVSELVVVGGGLAGTCCAITAARAGAKVVLMQDRPVLGGNASSEVRMWISGAGAHGENNLETGIVEEIELENLYRNPNTSYSIWDSILYEKVKYQDNITLL